MAVEAGFAEVPQQHPPLGLSALGETERSAIEGMLAILISRKLQLNSNS